MRAAITFAEAISNFGAAAKAKFTNPVINGQPEDQLRSPLEALLQDLAILSQLPENSIVAIGETSLSDLKLRPDFAITRQGALIGFLEVKAPGKGADPRKFKDKHDKEQWEKLKSLPNLVYTDGNEFSLWRNGELQGSIARLRGNVESSGKSLEASFNLLTIFSDFFQWEPVAPRSVKQLAEISAHLCRLLRDEVTEQMGNNNKALTDLAEDWRKLLFPGASDEKFADGYAQAVTFGLLMARAREIRLSEGLDAVARKLALTHSLIGVALRLLTDNAENQEALKTSLKTLTRVLDAVAWQIISKGDPEAWLYFYEHFLSAYDNELRKKTGSYYTPPEVVTAMVRLVDEVLKDPIRFGLTEGFASPDVTVADPGMGTGTFLMGVLSRIAETTKADLGPGAVPAAVQDSLRRLIGFEIQFGPFAVAQLRLFAEVADLMKLKGDDPRQTPLRLYVTDTLSNPDEETEWIPGILKPLAESRRTANTIKRDEPITVVIGNPPYKEKAKGLGGWVEAGNPKGGSPAPLNSWQPPKEWGVGAHAKHLRNLYVYFWRWATWKVFDGGMATKAPQAMDRKGVVCYITVAGFLNGPGFQKMRADLRRDADEIWVIDCSPEGHQPEVATRIFQGVQQPVCIVLASRLSTNNPGQPARVRFRSLPTGRREEKFAALAELTLDGEGWTECPSDWRASFLPEATGAWPTYPALDDLFVYNGSGVMPGRTWVIAPDVESLRKRWDRLIEERDPERKELLFHPHLVGGKPGDRHINRLLEVGLPGHEDRPITVAKDSGACITPIRYGFRTFDRQWIIPDYRLLNRPNPTLWSGHSIKQVYVTAIDDHAPSGGPALSLTGLVPDLHHYHGRGGRTFPLWYDAEAAFPNVKPVLLTVLSERYGCNVTGEDVVAYIAAVAAHPAYVKRFADDLSQPGLHVPITADGKLFAEALRLGREIVWLHTFGERFTDPKEGRPASPPRMSEGSGPFIPEDGAIPADPDRMPNAISYEAGKRRLRVGAGHIDNVAPEVWAYEVSGKQILTQWFSYRKKDRSRPLIGDRRPPSPLGDIQPEGWLPEYTKELLNVLHVLGRLVALEPAQADLLRQICEGPLLTADTLRDSGAFKVPENFAKPKPVKGKKKDQIKISI